MNVKISSFFLACLMFVTSCSRFYTYKENVDKKSNVATNQIDWDYLESKNHIIVHFADEVYEINNIHLDKNSSTISCHYTNFEGQPLFYYEKVVKDNDGIALRKVGDDKSITAQIHLFLKSAEFPLDDQITFRYNDIGKVDVSESAVGVNMLVTLLILIPATIAGFGIFLWIVCNCPHVYLHNGKEFVLNNSLFTGAKASQLERFDYKQLTDYFPDSTQLSLNIVNELNEIQFTNMVEILAVSHPENLSVLIDKNGNLHTISEPISPTEVFDNDRLNQLSLIKEADEAAYQFNPNQLTNLSELTMKFPGSPDGNGKLILSAKNTKWSGFVYNQFNALFGENHEKWVERNKNKSKEEREFWMRQEGIKMLVDVKTPNGWQQVDELELVGESNFNSMVIDLKSLPKDAVEIRLRSGFMFWELDYVAMDYSKDVPLDVAVLKPTSAIGSNGKDYKASLSQDDENYMDHLEKNTLTTVMFDGLPVRPNQQRSIILKSKGYYVSKEKYTGKTQRNELMKFKKPGELSRFSKKLYTDFYKRIALN